MFDLLVIGGGINGAGIARDAAGRGMKVALVEKDDLASHTSSASTKLVHGGLRYLEHYEFRLVRDALHEREVLLRIAPHLVRPMRFVLPHDRGLRPKWMLRLGLFLYDHIGGRRTLPGSRGIALRKPPHDAILQDRFRRGFEYSDCWVDDARLVVLNAVDARERGAEVMTRTECIALDRVGEHWRATLRAGGAGKTVRARAVVNAAGPWVDSVAAMATGGRAEAHLRLVKGSHIVIRRKFAGPHAYIFQNGDGRIVFAIPYERDFTLIGTTDQLFEGDPDAVAISEEERDYLCAAASEYFREPVEPADVVSTYAGIRPLYEDNAATNATVTRDYVFAIDAPDGETGGAPPLLSVYGGKITTYRKLAEHALERLGEHLEVPGEPWTADAALPGGDFAESFDAFLAEVRALWPWLPEETALRFARAYGTRIERVIGRAQSLADLGRDLGGGMTEAEADYLRREEFAHTAEDLLWRRSKLGLHMMAEAPEIAAAAR
ncbi:glycerol-3-phosphate dehydrogenase [Pelagerythrobacter aerophilus]|uniref:Glycerol-3-phosphate dehydrogenase n=1 Tax=Pelagerythrobacter aerophilus TaxID=2306995 RepID=A0A418NF04_9SPHN|nr:glycerol-3-phosphate dehydrogenase [Pelagerythrobacter aerophilus]RIV75790.1 glycerol-3-phosphate dehydrogenase [Pelagerythrobacter aerophilus]